MRYCFKEIKFRRNLIHFFNKVRNNLKRIFFTANKTLFLKYCGFVVIDMQYELSLVEGCGLSALPFHDVICSASALELINLRSSSVFISSRTSWEVCTRGLFL